MTDALRTLRKLDLDDDETISAAELSPINDPFAVQQQVRQATTNAPSTSPFLGRGSEEADDNQANRLITKYKTGNQGRSLSAKELGISAAAFARFDGDGDGQLGFDELKKFLSSPEPMLSLVVAVDSTEPLKAMSAAVELKDKLRTTADGAANINLGSTQLSVVRTSSFDLGNVEVFLKPQFMAADADANGYLEKAETERAFLYGATFEELDADKNGKVFLDEIVTFFRIRFDAARSRTVVSISEQGRTLFDILDTDRDRRLSFRELKAAADKLSLWDKDGDGLLAESEIPLQYRLTVSRGNLPALAGNFAAADMNQSGQLAERTSGPLWFRKMDKNRDGEVSRREFLGESATFATFDKNGDGFLDLAEAVQIVAE